MSTIKVTTIQDTAGANSSTTEAIANGIAKAWVNFNGTGTVAIRDDYNVNSITDNGGGSYTVNFTNSLPDTNYAPIGCVNFNNSTRVTDQTCCFRFLNTGSFRVDTGNEGNSSQDEFGVYVAVFR